MWCLSLPIWWVDRTVDMVMCPLGLHFVICVCLLIGKHCNPLLHLREECEVLHLLPDHTMGGVIRIGEFWPGQKAAVIAGRLS